MDLLQSKTSLFNMLSFLEALQIQHIITDKTHYYADAVYFTANI